MKFEEALKAMREGKYIRGKNWGKDKFNIFKDVKKKDGDTSKLYCLWNDEIISDDWEVVE